MNLTILTLPKRQLRKLANSVRTVTKTSFKIENTLHVSFHAPFWSMAWNNNDFKKAICRNQNLSLIKFHYFSIKIIIIPFSHVITQAYRSSCRIIKVFCVIDELNNVCFVPLIYHAQDLEILSFHYLVLKTIIFTLSWCLNYDHNWSPYRNNNVAHHGQ